MNVHGDKTSASQRAVKDTGKLFLAHLGAGACSIAFTAWLLRLVPDWGLALWPVCISLGGAISAFGSLGMGDSFVRIVPDLIARGRRREAAALMRTGLLLNAVACAVLAVALWLFAEPIARVLLHSPDMALYVRPLAVAAFFTGLRDRLGWGLTAVQEFGKQAILRFGIDVLRSPLAVVCYKWVGAPGLLLALTVVPMAACLLSLYWLQPHLRTGGTWQAPGSIVRFSWPYYGVSVSGFLEGQAHYLVVGVLGGPTILAPYFVAYRLAEYLRSLDRMAVTAVTPKLTERAGAQPEKRPRVFAKCMRYLFVGMLPLHVGAAALAGPLIALYGGAGYGGAANVFAVLCLGFFVETFYGVHRAHIQVFARPVQLLLLEVVAGVATVGGLLLFVPPLGALGAAVSALVVAVGLSLAGILLLRHTMSLRYDTAAATWATVGSLAVAAIAWSLQELLGNHGLGVIGATFVAGALAYLALLVSKLTAEDLDVFLGALPPVVWRNGVGQRFQRLLGALAAARQA